MKKVFISLFLTSILISGCATPVVQNFDATAVVIPANLVKEAKANLEYDLFDPLSMLYRNEQGYKLANGEYMLCGEINAKNRMGGYIGFSKYLVRFSYINGSMKIREKTTDSGQAACDSAASNSSVGIINQ